MDQGGERDGERRPSGTLEDAVLAVIDRIGPSSVARVRERLDRDLAHTTVMTAMTRLAEKGLLVRVRRGRAFEYSLAAPVGELPALRAALRMHTELDARARRADVLANFVAALDPEDEQVLRDLLTNRSTDESGESADAGGAT